MISFIIASEVVTAILRARYSSTYFTSAVSIDVFIFRL